MTGYRTPMKRHLIVFHLFGFAALVAMFFLLAGNSSIEPLLAAASLAFYAAMFLFVVVALPVVRTNA